VRRRSLGPVYRLAVVIVKPPLLLLTRRTWRGQEHLPRERGFVVAGNHLSHADPFTCAHFLHEAGFPPRFLAKEEIFSVPVGGWIARGARQIPVYRGSSDASRAYSAAVQAVSDGGVVVIYPEGTLTRDPDLWPMAGKTGAARVALVTGCPVVPLAQWGPQHLLPPYAKRPRLRPRTHVTVVAGPPVPLDDLRARLAGGQPDAATLREATDRILDAVTALLEEIRQEPAPRPRWDPRQHDLPRTGDPRRSGRTS